MEDQKHIQEGPEQELPPFVKTWRQFYRLLIGWIVFLILVFYAFTKYFQ